MDSLSDAARLEAVVDDMAALQVDFLALRMERLRRLDHLIAKCREYAQYQKGDIDYIIAQLHVLRNIDDPPTKDKPHGQTKTEH